MKQQLTNRWVWLLIGVLWAALAACSPPADAAATAVPDDGYQLDWKAPLFAPAVGPGQIQVTLLDAKTQQPIDDAVLSVKGDMDHDDMSAVLTSARSGVNGVYQMPFDWMMAGDWVLTVHAALPDGAQIERTFTMNVTGEDAVCDTPTGETEP